MPILSSQMDCSFTVWNTSTNPTATEPLNSLGQCPTDFTSAESRPNKALAEVGRSRRLCKAGQKSQPAALNERDRASRQRDAQPAE